MILNYSFINFFVYNIYFFTYNVFKLESSLSPDNDFKALPSKFLFYFNNKIFSKK